MTVWATRCRRCGERFFGTSCKHFGTPTTDMTHEEAERVKARYALGKRFNPDHDTTSYRDDPSSHRQSSQEGA